MYVGNVYNTVSGVVTIPQSGVYYLHIATYLYWNYIQGRMDLMVNGVLAASVYHTSYGEDVTRNHYITPGRAILLKLNAADTVHIRIPEGARINDNSAWETSFSGFLVYTV